MPDLLAVKVRLYPNKAQREQLDRTFGCCRFLWNQMLNEHREAYRQYKADGTEHVYKTEKEYKAIFPFLKEADSVALQATNQHLWEVQLKSSSDGCLDLPVMARIKSIRFMALHFRMPAFFAISSSSLVDLSQRSGKFRLIARSRSYPLH